VKTALRLASVFALLALSACSKTPKTDMEKASYAIGQRMGSQLTQVKDDIKFGSLKDGIADLLAGKDPKVSQEEMTQALMALQQKVQAAQSHAAAPAAAVDDEKASYAIGQRMASQLAMVKDILELKYLYSGLSDILGGKEPRISQDEMTQAMQAFGKKAQEAAMEQMKAKASSPDALKNKADGEAYQAKNKARAGVKVTADGLQYEVLKAGTGPKPKASSTVSVNYRGTLIDGTEFDASAKHGGPAQFPVGGVIRGWTEALQMMPVGSKWRLVIPGDLAYGAQGTGPQIGPNTTLVFEVELLAIK
jgi:FKBP-type peptidyl-prolyl cis-trans isomerase